MCAAVMVSQVRFFQTLSFAGRGAQVVGEHDAIRRTVSCESLNEPALRCSHRSGSSLMMKRDLNCGGM